MRYLLLTLETEKYWFELNDDNYANREIILDEYGELHFSCLEDCLAEGEVNETDLEGVVINSSKEDFENLWQCMLKHQKKQWELTKKKYFIGKTVQGICKFFYPQGTIVKGKDFIAVYKGKELFTINQLVSVEVKNYDDINMWLETY
ncbi:MAG: hypothetical protein II233_05920 [Clostridia bacterium]|nr:hypothetical protein [Clostridia bacterium]